MVEYLQIRNLALIEAVELEFGPGFVAVTGETGAGKSVLLGALLLLSGQRADRSLVRNGAESCTVEAVIRVQQLPEIAATLTDLDLPPCEEGGLLLRRVIHREKAGRVQVNGAMATTQALQALAAQWFAFHGPDAGQALRRPGQARAYLDVFAGQPEELSRYAEAWQAWRRLRSEMAELQSAEALSPEEAAFLEEQLSRIDRADLRAESIEELERDHTRLERVQELTHLAGSLVEALDGEEGVADRLAGLVGPAESIAEIDAEAADLPGRLEAAVVELRDLAETCSRIGEVSFDDEQAAEIGQRMELWLSLKRKYGPTVDAVLARREQMATKLSRQSGTAERLEALEAEAAKVEASLWKQARVLLALRQKAAKKLEKAVAARLVRLGFKKAAFAFQVTPTKNLSETGADEVGMLFSPNPGAPPQPLSQIASSGEAARVMLAMKAALAEADATPVLVFDEVDANVGGEVAVAVAEELGRLGAAHQVFCVTHLPQVAARASEHWVVRKDQTDETSSITLTALHPEMAERQQELARMLGDRRSASALKHAEALLAG